MLADEFDAWVNRHQTLFPRLREWFDDQPEPVAILTAWRSALAACRADHANEATDRMLRGVQPVVGFNDWASLPAAVVSHCRTLGSGGRSGDGNFVSGAELRQERRRLEMPADDREADAFRECRDMIEAMGPGDLTATVERIRDMLGGRLGAASVYRLVNMATRRAKEMPSAVGDAWEPTR